MRSCEYVKVPQQEKCQTEILLLRNLCFFDNSRLHDSTDGLRQHLPVPSLCSSSHCPSDPIVPGSQQQYSNLCHLDIWTHQSHHIKANLKCIARCHLGNWGGHPPYCQERNWNTLNPIGCSNGHVPQRLLCLPNHDDQTLVKQCIPTLHPKTGRRIQSRCLTQNANTYVPQAHPKLFIPNSFKPRSQATQSSRQYRDTKQCRGECGLASQASCFHTISLSSTIERQETHFIYFSQSQQTTPSHTDPWKYKIGGRISFGANRVGSGGFESFIEHDSKAQLPVCIC